MKVTRGDPSHGVGNCGAGARSVSAYPTNTLTDPVAALAAPGETSQVDATATAIRADAPNRSLRKGCFVLIIRSFCPFLEAL
jgi:hypothetical protein